MFQEQSGLLGGKLHRLRDQELLHLQRALADTILDLLEHDPFMQGVLIE